MEIFKLIVSDYDVFFRTCILLSLILIGIYEITKNFKRK